MGFLDDILGGINRAGDAISKTVDAAGDIAGSVGEAAKSAGEKLSPILETLKSAGIIGTPPVTGSGVGRAARQKAQEIAAAQQLAAALAFRGIPSGPTGVTPLTRPVSGGGRSLATFVDTAAMPGGAPIAQAGLGSLALRGLPLLGGALLEQALDLIPGGAGTGAGGLFTQSPARVTPTRRIMAQNPMNPNRIEVWEHAGTPILFSRDIRCAKRLAKIARRARGRR